MLPNPAVVRPTGVASTGQPLAPPGGGRMSTVGNNYEAHRMHQPGAAPVWSLRSGPQKRCEPKQTAQKNQYALMYSSRFSAEQLRLTQNAEAHTIRAVACVSSRLFIFDSRLDLLAP